MKLAVIIWLVEQTNTMSKPSHERCDDCTDNERREKCQKAKRHTREAWRIEIA
jgi:hypothetical protein